MLLAERVDLSLKPLFHPLIKNLLQKEKELDFIESEVWFSKKEDKIDRIAFFYQGKLQKILFISYIRLSFHDIDPVPVLYEIAFGSERENPPEVKIYKEEKSHLRILNISRMNPLEKKEHFQSFTCMEGGVLELNLKIYPTANQKVFEFENRDGQFQWAFTTAVIVKNSLIRLHNFLELLDNENLSDFFRKELLEDIEKLLQEVQKNKSLRENGISALSLDPVAIQALVHYRYHSLGKGESLEVEKLIEEILTKSQIKHAEIGEDRSFIFHLFSDEKEVLHLIKSISPKENAAQAINKALKGLEKSKKGKELRVEIYLHKPHTIKQLENLCRKIEKNPSLPLKNLTFIVPDGKLDFFSYNENLEEEENFRHVNPYLREFLELHRLSHFQIALEKGVESPFTYLYYAKAPVGHDFRLMGTAFVYSKIFQPHTPGYTLGCPLEHLNLREQLDSLTFLMQKSLEALPSEKRPVWNRIFFPCLPLINSSENEVLDYLKKIIPTQKIFKILNLEKFLFKIKLTNPSLPNGYQVLLVEFNSRQSMVVKHLDTYRDETLISPAKSDEGKEQQIRMKGGTWAYRIPEILKRSAEKFKKTGGMGVTFTELDLDPASIVIDPKTGTADYNFGKLRPILRPAGLNEAGVVIGLQTLDLNVGTPVKYLLVLGDITHTSKGSITAQECARINAAIRYASREKIPINWFSASFGVEIQKDRGVESLDASSSTTREIIYHCHHKGLQINLIIDETNIGAQSYWDALAAISHETSGLLIMTKRGSMALTGPNALVSALHSTAHSLDIPSISREIYPHGLQTLSGYEHVHGINSDSMVGVKDIEEACDILVRHLYFSYLGPEETIVSTRPSVNTNNKMEGDSLVLKEIQKFQQGFKPNREVILEALMDEGSPFPLQLWKDSKGIRGQGFRKGDLAQECTTLVYEMLIGGIPTMVIFSPIGPLTPADADIIARAIFKANHRMPVLIIGSLTGFTCDPLSMQNRQLAAGASIAKAIVDHSGPILIVNMGNLVGGTFVVFSKQLNPNLRIIAMEGSRVQVIGGKGAAKVVFHSKIVKIANEDPRVKQISDKIHKAKKLSEEKRTALHNSLLLMRRKVIEELENKEGVDFDTIHNVQRAVKVGSIDEIITLKNWRKMVVRYIRGMRESFLNTKIYD